MQLNSSIFIPLPLPAGRGYYCIVSKGPVFIYHKVDEYYGVMIDGHTVFSGSLLACEEYMALFAECDAL